MNLKSRKARLPIAALGACALVTGGGVLTAGSAFAASSVTFTDSTATSVNTVDLGSQITASAGADFAGTTPALQAAGTYALKLSSTGTTNLYVSLDSYTPAGASAATTVANVLKYKATATDTAPATGYLGVGSNSATSVKSAVLTATPYVYLAPTASGTYKLRVVDDQGTGATDDDAYSSTVTLNVKDVVTAGGGDDWAPSVTTSASSIAPGDPVTTSVNLSSLTLVDGRGSSGGKGILGNGLAALTGVDFFQGATQRQAIGAVSNPDGKKLLPVGNGAVAGTTLTSTAKFDTTASGWATTPFTLGAATSSVTSNTVATLNSPAFAATAESGKVVVGSGTATVLPGTSTVTYSVTAKDSTPAAVAGATVYFTLHAISPVYSTTATTLTADGTLVSSDSTSGDKIYSAVTNSSGVATIKVTSDKTSATNQYSVQAASNNAPAQTVTTTYSAAAPASVKITSTSSDLTQPTTASSVTVTGQVVDQFGNVSQPASSSPQQIVVSGAATGNVPLSGGKFSYTYTPSSTPSAGTSSALTFTYNAGPAATATIRWTTTTAAGSLTLSSPSNGATGLALQTGVGAPTSSLQVSGLVKDAGSTSLAGAPVTLTGTDGVYFSSSATPGSATLEKTFKTVSDTSGSISGVYVFLTKAGDAKITATSGTATASSTITTAVAAAGSAYKVTADDIKVKPGTTVTLTGKVTDAFGNPVVGVTVNLAQDTSSAGSLGGASDVTDANGIWAQTFTATSNQSGTVKVTATLNGQAANRTADANYALAGVTVADGVYKATSTVEVGNVKLTIQSSPQLTYGSKYYARGALLSGDANPGSSVDIYAKIAGGGYQQIDTVTADAQGEWGAVENISKSTYFIAKSDGVSSTSSLTKVYSGVILTAVSAKADRVTLSANGGPNASAYLYFYRVFANGDTDYVGKKLSSEYGNGSITVKAPSGNRKYKVLFKAPGTYTGSDTDSVKVK